MITVDLFEMINNNNSINRRLGLIISYTLDDEKHYSQINLVTYYTSFSSINQDDDHEPHDNILSKLWPYYSLFFTYCLFIDEL